MFSVRGDSNDMILFREKLLVFEASRWVGVTEVGGDNKGQLVEIFQRAADGLARGESWCVSFIQYCLKMTDRLFDEIMLSSNASHGLLVSESVLQVWDKTPVIHRCQPHPGAVMLWEFYKDGKPTGLGHAEIVTLSPSQGSVLTIGGNTGPGAGVQREGDGVYARSRSLAGSPEMQVKGFLQPWIQRTFRSAISA